MKTGEALVGNKVRIPGGFRPSNCWGRPSRFGEIVEYDPDHGAYWVHFPHWNTTARMNREDFIVSRTKGGAA